MNKGSKQNLEALAAIAGIIGLGIMLMLKNDQGALGSSGGLGAGLGGLPPSGGGGGADTPTINLDFPALPPIVIGDTKKEDNTAPSPTPSPIPTWMTTASVEDRFTPGGGFGGGGAGGRGDTTKKYSLWDRLMQGESYDTAATPTTKKTTSISRSDSFGPGAGWGAGITTRTSPTPVTKKESTSRYGGGSTGSYGSSGEYYTSGRSDPGYYGSVMNAISSGITRGL